MDVRDPCEDVGDLWFVTILLALPNLEHIEFGGNFPAVMQRLCREVVQGGLCDPIQTLIVRAAGEYETGGVQPRTHRGCPRP